MCPEVELRSYGSPIFSFFLRNLDIVLRSCTNLHFHQQGRWGNSLFFTWVLRGLQISDSSPAYGSKERSRNTNQLQHFTKFYWFEHVQTVIGGWLEYRFVKTLGIKSRVTLFSQCLLWDPSWMTLALVNVSVVTKKSSKIGGCDWFLCLLIAGLRLRKYPNLGYASFVARREKKKVLQETHNISSSLGCCINLATQSLVWWPAVATSLGSLLGNTDPL